MPLGHHGDRWGRFDPYRNEHNYEDLQRAQPQKKISISEQMSIFAAITGKEIYEIIQQAKMALSASKKKFVKPKETNTTE